MRLVEMAFERGAVSLAELEELAAPRPAPDPREAAPRPRRAGRAGRLSLPRPERRVLYVGKARDLGAAALVLPDRKQRPTVEAALDRLDHVEWRPPGPSSLPRSRRSADPRAATPANTHTPQPERYVYLHRRGERVVVSRLPSAYGPFRRRAQAQRAAQALKGCTAEEFDDLLDGDGPGPAQEPPGRAHRGRRGARGALLRRRIGSLERAIAHLRRLERLRELDVCVLAPSLEPGRMDAYIVSGGSLVGPRRRRHKRAMQPGRVRAEELDALLVMESFLLRPPGELTIIPLGRRDCRRAA